MEWISIAIAGVAFGFSIFTFCRHDRKLKKQEKQINEFQLLKLKKETALDKQAIIEANVINKGNGSRIVKVYNKGRSIAQNVSIKFLNEDAFFVLNNPSPIDIKPQASVELKLEVTDQAPDKIQIYFQWKDGFKTNNTDEQTIQI